MAKNLTIFEIPRKIIYTGSIHAKNTDSACDIAYQRLNDLLKVRYENWTRPMDFEIIDDICVGVTDICLRSPKDGRSIPIARCVVYECCTNKYAIEISVPDVEFIMPFR